MPARTLVCLCLLLASCGTVREWRYLRSDPMPVGKCYDGIVEIAAGEFAQDPAESDRGEGRFVSRWRQRVKENRHLARNRLRPPRGGHREQARRLSHGANVLE